MTKRTIGNTDSNTCCVSKIACTYTCVSFRANGAINRCTRDWLSFFNVKREQEITKEEVAMPFLRFLRLFARGAQVLNAGLPFPLKV